MKSIEKKSVTMLTIKRNKSTPEVIFNHARTLSKNRHGYRGEKIFIQICKHKNTYIMCVLFSL